LPVPIKQAATILAKTRIDIFKLFISNYLFTITNQSLKGRKEVSAPPVK
jgi:hypothetical protein